MVDSETGSAWAKRFHKKITTGKKLKFKVGKYNPKGGKLWTYRAYADHHKEWNAIMQATFNKSLKG